MQKLLLSLFIVFCAWGSENQNVVYGEDNRVSPSETPWKDLSESVAIKISKNKIIERTDEYTIIESMTLAEEHFQNDTPLCEDVRFKDSRVIGDCTAFYVGERKMVTAGHCVMADFLCKANLWGLNYNDEMRVNSEGHIYFPNDRLLECKKLIVTKSTRDLDFAIFEVDKTPLYAAPFEISYRKKVKETDEMFIMGYPEGLPIKIVEHTQLVSKVSEKGKFQINSDSFVGNSGSPVFDQSSGEVIGLMIGGESDYEFDKDRGCYKVRVCDETCQGETVLKIDHLMNYLLPSRC